VIAGCLPQLGAQHPRFDPCPAGVGIDRHAPHPLGLEQDRPVEWSQRRRAVTGALRGDLQIAFDGEANGGGNVVGAIGKDDGDGSLVGGEVPGGARLVPVDVVGGGDPAGDRQPGEVGHLRLLAGSVSE
jgi:hypothetical protein